MRQQRLVSYQALNRPQASHSACASNDLLLAVNDDVISYLPVGIARHIWNSLSDEAVRRFQNCWWIRAAAELLDTANPSRDSLCSEAHVLGGRNNRSVKFAYQKAGKGYSIASDTL
jgi:hypothetical protein